MIPVFKCPHLAARMQDDVRRAMAATVPASARPRRAAASAVCATGPQSGKAADRMLGMMVPGQCYLSRDFADGLSMPLTSVSSALARLEASGRIRRAGRSAHGRIQYELVEGVA